MAAATLQQLQGVEVEHLTDLTIDFAPVEIVSTPLGTRLTYIVERGVADGLRLRGELVPGGGDWVVIGADGVARLDVRASLHTHDGHPGRVLQVMAHASRGRLAPACA